MRVVAVAANKGGVGKSTLAFQVAAELALRGKRVLAVDADKQADLTGYARGPRIAGLGLDGVLANPAGSLDPRPYIGPVAERFDLLGSSSGLGSTERLLSTTAGGVLLLRRVLDVVAGDYDWVVIDAGHAEHLVAAVVVAADLLLMPTAASSPDADHAGDVLQAAAEARRKVGLPARELLGRSMITVWRRQHNGLADAHVIDRLTERYGDLVCPVVIPHSSRVSEANGQRLTVRQHAQMYGSRRDPALGAVVEAFSRVTDQLIERATAPDAFAELDVVESLAGDEPDARAVASALRRVKHRRRLDDDQLAEVLGRPVEWVRQTLAFGARHPEGEDRLTIRPRTRRSASEAEPPRPPSWPT